jgi:hypothetical protein
MISPRARRPANGGLHTSDSLRLFEGQVTAPWADAPSDVGALARALPLGIGP